MTTGSPGSATATLGRMARPDLDTATVLVIPVGSCEQHGPHLPFSTDTMVATAVAERAAARCPATVVGPPLAYGSSGEHAGFGGTLSIGTEVLVAVVVELVRSADAFDGVAVVSGHGGNVEGLRRAADLLEAEGRPILVWSPSTRTAATVVGRAADTHAGWVETSVLMALEPTLVHGGRLAAGDTRPLGELLPLLRTSGVAAVSPSGVLGDPTPASAATGRCILDAWVAELAGALTAFAAARRTPQPPPAPLTTPTAR